MTLKQLQNSAMAPDGSTYITLTDGAGNLVTSEAPSGPAGGSLSGTYPNPGLASTIIAAGPIGAATTIPVITYNAAGQLTTVTTAATGVTTVGTAVVGQIPGTATNDSASAGNVGQIISATLAGGSAINLTSSVPANITSISLTAGDWDVDAVVYIGNGAGTVLQNIRTYVSTTSAGPDGTPGHFVATSYGAGLTLVGSVTNSQVLPPTQFSFATTTTVYLIADHDFTTSTLSSYGTIRARRVR